MKAKKQTVTLKKGETLLVLPAPIKLERKAEDSPDGFDTKMEWRSLTTEQKDALTLFFKDIAGGMKENWTYTDPAGRDFQARFANPALVFVMFGQNVWDVSLGIKLREMD